MPERFCPRDWNFSANGLCWAKAVSQGSDHRGVAAVGAVVAQQGLEGVGAFLGGDGVAGLFGKGDRAADLAPGAPGDGGGW